MRRLNFWSVDSLQQLQSKICTVRSDSSWFYLECCAIQNGIPFSTTVLSASSKRPRSTTHFWFRLSVHWGGGSNCPSNWNWGRRPDFVGSAIFSYFLVEGDSSRCLNSSAWNRIMESEIESRHTPSQFNNRLDGLTWLKQNSFIWNPKNLRNSMIASNVTRTFSR